VPLAVHLERLDHDIKVGLDVGCARGIPERLQALDFADENVTDKEPPGESAGAENGALTQWR
jgi:hypothetical protein